MAIASISNPNNNTTDERLAVLLSIVITAQNNEGELFNCLQQITSLAERLVSDYEIIVVDNGSTDGTLHLLHGLTANDGLPNLQIFSLASAVDAITAQWVGIENSLGDLVVCLDWQQGDLNFFEAIIHKAGEGHDLVFTKRLPIASRRKTLRQSVYQFFVLATRLSTGLALNTYSTSFIVLSRRIVSYLLQFPDPQIKFRNLAGTAGFRRTSLDIPSGPTHGRDIHLKQSISRGLKLITATSTLPLRMATALSALGAGMSILYSIYIVLVWMFKKNIAPGWVSLSMQQSLMFFLISMVLLVLSEYVLEISRKAHSGPSYYIAAEYTSAKLLRKQRLNIEEEQGLHHGR
jgi:polyisoprenyl-phosphate glycosyltransferase